MGKKTLCVILVSHMTFFFFFFFLGGQFYNFLWQSVVSSLPHQLCRFLKVVTDFWKWLPPWYIGNQHIELVWWIFIIIMFSGQPHTDMVGDIPHIFGPDSFVRHSVNEHIGSSHLLAGQFLDLSEYLRGTLLKSTPGMCLWMLMVYSLVTTWLVSR